MRERERHIDRRGLDDGCQGGRVRLTHEVADLDHGHAGASGNRGAHRAVAELDVEIFQLCRVGVDRRAVNVDLGSCVLQRDDGGGVLGHELGIARHVAFSLLEIGLGPVEQAFHLLCLRFDRAAVQGEQQVTLIYRGAVPEMDADDLAVDARLDRDAGDRRDRAQYLDADRNGFLLCNCDFDRDSARCALPRRLRVCTAGPQLRDPAPHGVGNLNIATDQSEACCRKHHNRPERQDSFAH